MSAYEATSGPNRGADSSLSVQIEVRDERELREALDAGAQAVLLDNMKPDEARRCVEIVRGSRKNCVVEISEASRWRMRERMRKAEQIFFPRVR